MTSKRKLSLLALMLVTLAPCLAGAGHAQIVSLGASNVAGRGVAPSETFSAQLERMLAAKGYSVQIANAGISGDTNSGILNRLDSAVPQGTRIVLLGMRGGTFNAQRLGQGEQKAELATIMARLRARGIKVIPVTGNGIGRKYLQPDGIHLSAEGHAAMAAQLLPSVMRALGRR